MTSTFNIRRGGESDLPSLEPLWVAVHHRHVESMPQLAPYVDDVTTWVQRSELYRELLAKPDTILLLADVGADPIGYGLAHILAPQESWIADTWVTGKNVGEIESVSVLPAYRGQGIGTSLLDRLEQELTDVGVDDLILGVLPGNGAAIRMYERRGYRPTWLYMSRFVGRSAPPAS
jgi:ribosomal protein S18 acetylase RimI-like enzyme